MPFVKKYVVLGLVAHIRGEIFANNTMPVGAVFFVKFFLDVLGHFVFNFDIVDGPFGFFHGICLHIGVVWHVDESLFGIRHGVGG